MRARTLALGPDEHNVLCAPHAEVEVVGEVARAQILDVQEDLEALAGQRHLEKVREVRAALAPVSGERERGMRFTG
jgi:Mg-chelatase subunit ChlI